MCAVQPIKLQIYRDSKGRAPYTKWRKSIKDRTTRARIQTGVDRLRSGNFSKCKSVKGSVFEIRLKFGPGYRVYFGKVDNTIVLLLCGGDKSTQDEDIKQAKAYWREYKESQK